MKKTIFEIFYGVYIGILLSSIVWLINPSDFNNNYLMTPLLFGVGLTFGFNVFYEEKKTK